MSAPDAATPPEPTPSDPVLVALLRQLLEEQRETNAHLARLVGQDEDDFSGRAKPPEIWIEYGHVCDGLLEDAAHPILSHDIAKKNTVLMDKAKAGMWCLNQWGRFVTRHYITNLPVREPAVEVIGLGKRVRWGKKRPEDWWVYVARKDAWHHVKGYAIESGILDEKEAAQTAVTYALDESPEKCYYCLRDKAKAERENADRKAAEIASLEGNFEGITKLYRLELAREDIVPLRPGFLDEIAAYVARLEAHVHGETLANPDSPKALMLQDELQKVLKRRDQILEIRARKDAGTWTPPPRRRTI